MPPLRSAAVLLHPKIAQAREVADVVCAALDDCTLSVSRASAWDVTRLRELLPHGVELQYVGRPARAAPAEGSTDTHAAEQQRIVHEAFGIEPQ
jgi:hypothetical protein